ncbi:hypothetical protein EI427_12115 [Flammeovirga pectinis]|uniref:Uncharacterized protein n=1 Tax=Flammeovirga pectinis TaxID=2494373 RepID=A0A3Q9FLP9_9BACT|nr:hypothetical protein [Flammeovirga pectinis]AZQ62956.1 hypothetical protein EI427_12115 [Flammeovirga pectinis]
MKDFYIGYINKLPKRYKIALSIGLPIFLITLIFASIIFSTEQEQFQNGTFELSKETTIEGMLFQKPVPMLKIEVEKGYFKDILLVDKGKFGAENRIAHLPKKEGLPVKIKGHLIYYNGHSVLEIEEINALESKLNFHAFNNYLEGIHNTIIGEIVDPKCYFGIMKPGFGKIHRSCAIRCISGGIPAVLVHRNNDGLESYYIITRKDGTKDNSDLFDLIGKTVQIHAKIKKGKDWNFLELDDRSKKLIINEQGYSYYPITTTLPTETVVCKH